MVSFIILAVISVAAGIILWHFTKYISDGIGLACILFIFGCLFVVLIGACVPSQIVKSEDYEIVYLAPHVFFKEDGQIRDLDDIAISRIRTDETIKKPVVRREYYDCTWWPCFSRNYLVMPYKEE